LVNSRFYRDAEDLARKAIKRGSKDSLHKEMLGISLVFQRKYEDAIPVIKDVLASDPNKGVMWQLLSLAHGNLGQNSDAAEALRKMMDLNFNGVQARRILNELESTPIDVPGMPGMTMRVKTAASVEQSDDDSLVTNDEYILMQLMMRDGATSEEKGLGPLAERGNSWMISVLDNLVAKGFAVFTKSRKAYLTEKGVKRYREM
jgi:tetratricopeptide (TPR) repeat protein